MSSKRIKDWFGGCFRLVKAAPRIKRWVAGLVADLASGICRAAVNLHRTLLAWRRTVWYRVVPVRPQPAYRPRRVRLELERLEDILAPAALFTYTGAADGTTGLAGDYLVNGQVATMLPGAADTIQFTPQYNTNCTVSANLQVAEVEMEAGYTANLSIEATLTTAYLSIASGSTMQVGGEGTATWDSGVVAGVLDVNTGGTLNIATANPHSIVTGGVINILGVANWTGDASNQDTISLGSYGAIDVQEGGVFNLSANTTESITGDSTTVFLNEGQVSLGNAGTLWIGAPTQSQGGTYNSAAGSQMDFYGPTTVAAPTSFTGSGTVTIGATMTLQGEVTPDATVTFVLESTGTLAGASGALNMEGGTFNWVGGTISTTLNIWSATLNISEPAMGEGGGYQINGGSVNILGTANWTPDLDSTGTIYLSNNGSLNIDSAGDFNVLPGTTTGSITSDGSGVLSNSGSLVLAPGAFLVISAPSTSTGTYNTGAGTITFSRAGVFNDGTILTGTGGTIYITGNMTLKGTTSQTGLETVSLAGMLSGSGTLNIAESFVTSGGTLQGSGTVNISGTVFPNATINGLTINGFNLNNSGLMTWASGNITLTTGVITNNSVMFISGQAAQAILPGANGPDGAFENAGRLFISNPSTTTFNCDLSQTAAGTLTLQAGSLVAPGDWTEAGGTISLAAQTSLQVGGTLAIQGIMTMGSQATLRVNAGLGLGNNATLTLASQATVTVNAALANNGTLTLASQASVTVNGAVTNNGILTLASQDTITVNGTGFTNQGTVNVGAGALQTTIATVLVTNSGTISFSPTAQLNVLPIRGTQGGNFTQTGTGVINATIGPNPAGGFSSGLLNIGGTAAYGGTFKLTVDPNGPQPGTNYSLMVSGGGCNGQFANLIAITPGWTLTADNTGVRAR